MKAWNFWASLSECTYGKWMSSCMHMTVIGMWQQPQATEYYAMCTYKCSPIGMPQIACLYIAAHYHMLSGRMIRNRFCLKRFLVITNLNGHPWTRTGHPRCKYSADGLDLMEHSEVWSTVQLLEMWWVRWAHTAGIHTSNSDKNRVV